MKKEWTSENPFLLCILCSATRASRTTLLLLTSTAVQGEIGAARGSSSVAERERSQQRGRESNIEGDRSRERWSATERRSEIRFEEREREPLVYDGAERGQRNVMEIKGGNENERGNCLHFVCFMLVSPATATRAHHTLQLMLISTASLYIYPKNPTPSKTKNKNIQIKNHIKEKRNLRKKSP